MSEITIQHALKLFEEQARKRRPPNLAVLGPPGSGKTIFLDQLLSKLNNAETFPKNHCLMLDLRSIPVDSQDEIYFHINRVLLQEAARIGIKQDFNIVVQPPPLRFGEILSHLLHSVDGYLIIFIDHLESVPLLFASDLSHRFRHFLEAIEQDSEYRRLGLIVAGAVSLYELKHGPNSAFQMLPLISFPQVDHEIRRDMVESYLQNYMSTEISSELIDLLANLTGGEPGFLEPLVMHLIKGGRQVSLDEELILSSVEEICSYSQVLSLRNLALHLWGDKGLREIVRDLNSKPMVPPRSVAPDIDRYQLAGAVVMGRGPYAKSFEYQFRNKIVGDLLTRLYKALEDEDKKQQARILVMDELEKIESAKSNCLQATQIWKWTKYLRDAWETITPYSLPNIFLYVTKHGANYGWWLDASLKRVSGPELREEIGTSTKLAAINALDKMPLHFGGETENLRAFIESDADQISIGLPLCARNVIIILVATLSRTDAGRGLTEFDLCHWIRFLQNVKHVVPTLTLAELGQRMIGEPFHEINRPQSAKPSALASSNASNKSQVKHIYLLPKGEGIVKEAQSVTTLSWTIDNKTIEDLNNRCLGMVDQWMNYKDFEERLGGIATQLATTLTVSGQDLRKHLIPNSFQEQIVLATDKEGLKIPFELFPHEKSHLGIVTALSRQIINYQLPPDVCAPFQLLIQSLVKAKEELRVLLVASDVDGKLQHATEELRQIRTYIESGCKRIGLQTRFVEILPEQATVKRLEEELIGQRPYQLFHFTGHAMHFTEDPNASGVVLFGEDNEPEVVSCKRLQRWLEGAGIWLAYLSSCHSSASTGTGKGLSEKYTGTIDAVVSAGVPNVVGFRWLVSDQGAMYLATEFYRQLFEVQSEKNISIAMLNARRSVERRTDFFDAWASSMLITQSS